VNSPYLRAICDFAHVNVFTSGQPLELIHELLPFIGHTHLCGNDGSCTDFESHSSTHLTLGEGSMDWKAMLGMLLDSGYTDWLDIDLWEHPDPMAGAEAGKRVLDDYLATESR
jgi:sugar phosphate isomerase/epimerase